MTIDHELTWLDEAAGWALAALGFLFQWRLGFHPPWLLGLLLWPLDVIEGFIIWSINSSSPVLGT